MKTTTDHDLIALAREGRAGAVAELWSRHAPAATKVARRYVDITDADDLVSEAFLQIIVTLRRGAGPSDYFRPYLSTVVRNLAFADTRRRSKLDDGELDLERLAGVEEPPALEQQWERDALGRAFLALPQRWQEVLWHLEVEGKRPREVAALVDMRSGAVSSLAYRARVALRAGWVQEHVEADRSSAECREVLAGFGDYQAGRLAPAARRSFESHVRECPSCPDVIEQATRSSGRIAFALGGMIVGGGAVLHGGLGAAPSASAAVVTSSAAKPVLTGIRHLGSHIGVGIKVACLAVPVAGAAVGVTLLGGAVTAPARPLASAVAPLSSPQIPDRSSPPALPDDPDPAALPVSAPPSSDPDGAQGDRPRRVPVLPPDPAAGAEASPGTPSAAAGDTVAPPPPTIAPIPMAAMALPTVTGTAEPASTVHLVAIGSGASVDATVAADGTWSAVIPGMHPTDRAVHATALDAAHNISDVATSAPFAFVPAFRTPTDGQVWASGPVFILASGWPGAEVALRLGALDLGTYRFDASGALDLALTSGDGAAGLPPGSYTFSLAYLGPDGSEAPDNQVSVTMTVGGG